MSKTIKIPGRLESAETGKVVAGANAILDDTKGKKQNVINEETDAELLRLDQEKQGNLTFDQTPTEDSTNPVTSGGVYAADQMLSQAIEAILLLIPSAASELNKLVDLATMNSSISTATASFKGTYNLVSDLHLTVSATHAQIAAALDALSLGADNNDYAFVQVPNTDTAPTDIAKTERYKFNGENWAYEYDLNNSGFTTAQWNAINSGITTLLVAKLSALPTNEALTLALAGKQDNLTFDNAPTAGSDNPVKSGGIYTRNNEIVALINALDVAKQNVLTFDTTPTNGSTNPVTSNGVYLAIQLVQTAVVALDGRMGTAETKISTAEGNIANLQAAYAALTQSDIVVVSGALPSSGQQQNIIYRQPDQDHTPPQFYSDYMWNGTAWVLMATYNNAIDPRPKKASQNLVTSGGVFDNMGALDVSELNATENPHTLKPYATLDAALADIPSDYQKGGMSIKFVRTSDDKYVQYRLMSDTFNTTPANWQGVDEEPTAGSKNLVKSGGIVSWGEENYGKYIESPEFVYVKTDKDDKILWAIKIDGGIYYGAGVPQQVKDYIEEKIAELSLDEYEDIVAFLNGLEEGDKTLQTLLNEKVDKEEGKSLIDADYASTKSTVDNPEFLDVTLDTEDKVLEGIKTDGTKVIGGDVQIGGNAAISGDATILGNVDIQGATYTLMQNPEWIKVIVDSQHHILCGIKTDGSIYLNSLIEIPSIIQDAINAVSADTASLDERITALESVFSVVDSLEYITVETDSEGKILEGRRANGNKVEYCDVEYPNGIPKEIANKLGKKISILFVGNSMTQDAISYLPYVLKHIAPDIEFKFYIYFTGGVTLAEHYNAFLQEWYPGTFSICENVISWNNQVSWEQSSIKQSMKAWLKEINFDILCLQDYFNGQPNTDNAVTDFNNCLNYIRDNYEGQFKVITLFHRPKTNVFMPEGPQSTLECFNMIKDATEKYLKYTACQSVIPCGVASYFATLDAILQPLGQGYDGNHNVVDYGNLTPDTTHAQDTLGCLLQAYTAALWVFSELGLPNGIYNKNIRINQTLFDTINPPGPNVGTGIIVGTDEENNEAQLIAIKAYKYGLNLINNSLVE